MEIAECVKKWKIFLLDLDGTVYIDGALIGDMKRTLETLRKHGKRLIYLTNNSSRTKEDYVRRLTGLGIYGEEDDVYTSGDATIAYLKRHCAGRRVYLTGTEKVRESFLKQGIRLEEEDPEVVVLSYDTEIDYEKISKTARFLRRGLPYIATHPDVNCPAKPAPVPDVGSFIRMFEASAGRVPDVIVGKPYRYMAEGIRELTGTHGDEVVMVGDRLYTDIAFGANNGFSSLLVFSGETTEELYRQSAVRADLTLQTLNDIVKYL